MSALIMQLLKLNISALSTKVISNFAPLFVAHSRGVHVWFLFCFHPHLYILVFLPSFLRILFLKPTFHFSRKESDFPSKWFAFCPFFISLRLLFRICIFVTKLAGECILVINLVFATLLLYKTAARLPY